MFANIFVAFNYCSIWSVKFCDMMIHSKIGSVIHAYILNAFIVFSNSYTDDGTQIQRCWNLWQW